MAEDGQEPTWLADLRGQEPAEQPRVTRDLEEPPARTSMLENLREQMIQAEEEFEQERKSSPAQFVLDMAPWQRLVLAVLLFLNVALCGCMGLVMAGRVALPF